MNVDVKGRNVTRTTSTAQKYLCVQVLTSETQACAYLYQLRLRPSVADVPTLVTI